MTITKCIKPQETYGNGDHEIWHLGDVPKICEDLKITSEKYKVRVEKAQISGCKNMSPKVNISKMKESRLVDAFPWQQIFDVCMYTMRELDTRCTL